nr:glucomannan 4-beta-mannosyltransferase 9-like [Ipomoea batatas]
MDPLSSTASAVLNETFSGAGDDVSGMAMLMWGRIRGFRLPPVVPLLLNIAVYLCLIMSTMLFVERVYMGVVMFLVKLLRRTPEKRFKYAPLEPDAELGNAIYPMILVQIPMYNEREVYKLSIGAACALTWPSDRIIIQVLDDSTDPIIKNLVETECQKWASHGVDIKYEIRDNRNGYKAGALKEGMKRYYVKQCDYVVIFDADFQPETDFLERTIPFLVHNPKIALVQARWKFVNADECLMTRMQEMSLDYHFTVEQEVGSSTYAFFGFNGTAGVWRIAAIDEAGGWNHRTTVEDMDLAVRASLRGWKFLYIGTLTNVNAWKKVHVIYSFFFVRKVIAHIVTFVFYCVVLPTACLVPEVDVPKWGAVYIPVVITILNSVGTPRSFHMLSFWLLFENVMALHRTKGTFIGLLEVGRVNEWIVTEKLGDAFKLKSAAQAIKTPRFKIAERVLVLELCFGAYLLFCGCYDLIFGKQLYYWYIILQAIAFFIIGFGYVGTIVPTS